MPTRKVVEALWLWRQYPTQIEADLLPTVDIADWHQGTTENGRLKLSSRRLLVVLQHLPAMSAFKTALRGGEWSEDQQMWALAANEVSKLRATMHFVHGGKKAAYSPMVLIPPSERQKRVDAQLEAERAQEDFYADLGWS